MCHKTVDDYADALKFVSDWYKTQEICIKAIDTQHLSTIKYVHVRYKTQEVHIKAVNTYSFVFDTFPVLILVSINVW